MICRANCLLMALLAATGGAKIRKCWHTFHFYWVDRNGEAWDFYPLNDQRYCGFLFLGYIKRRKKWDEPHVRR